MSIDNLYQMMVHRKFGINKRHSLGGDVKNVLTDLNCFLGFLWNTLIQTCVSNLVKVNQSNSMRGVAFPKLNIWALIVAPPTGQLASSLLRCICTRDVTITDITVNFG